MIKMQVYTYRYWIDNSYLLSLNNKIIIVREKNFYLFLNIYFCKDLLTLNVYYKSTPSYTDFVQTQIAYKKLGGAFSIQAM